MASQMNDTFYKGKWNYFSVIPVSFLQYTIFLVRTSTGLFPSEFNCTLNSTTISSLLKYHGIHKSSSVQRKVFFINTCLAFFLSHTFAIHKLHDSNCFLDRTLGQELHKQALAYTNYTLPNKLRIFVNDEYGVYFT